MVAYSACIHLKIIDAMFVAAEWSSTARQLFDKDVDFEQYLNKIFILSLVRFSDLLMCQLRKLWNMNLAGPPQVMDYWRKTDQGK